MSNLLKKNMALSIISSLVFLLLGIIIVCNPTTILKIVAYILGSLILIFGIIKLIGVLINKEQIKMYSGDIIIGMVFVALGIFVITCSSTIGSFFRIIIGIWIIYNAFINCIYSIKLKNVGLNIWFVLFIFSVIMLASGIYVATNPGAIISTIGIIVIIYSVIDLIESTIIYSNVDKLQ